MSASNGSVTQQVEPTNVTVKPEHRKKRLVRKHSGPNPLKEKAWLVGHFCCIGFGSISLAFQFLWLPNWYYINSIAYRLSLLGSILAMGATLSHKFGIHYLPTYTSMLAQQNFQYLILAFIWIFTFKSVFKIIPYFLISILQIGAQKKITVITEQAQFLASVIAYDELILVFYLFLRTLLFRNTSGYQLSAFLILYWLRILYNNETFNLFKEVVTRLDGKVSAIKNDKVQGKWKEVKLFLREKIDSQTY